MIDWPTILTEHGPAVWRTVCRLLGRHADALDCYQDTFLAAWRFSERSRVSDWPALLTMLATRRAMDRLRQRYRTRVAALDAGNEPAGEAESPHGYATATELMEQVRGGLAGLPDKQAQAFWLSCIEGLPHEQIGDRLDVPQGEVRVLLHRARTHLRRILDGGAPTKGDDHE